MDYSRLAALTNHERLAAAQGRLRHEYNSNLILVAPLSTEDARIVTPQTGAVPSGIVNIYRCREDLSLWLVYFADWRELGFFVARDPRDRDGKASDELQVGGRHQLSRRPP